MNYELTSPQTNDIIFFFNRKTCLLVHVFLLKHFSAKKLVNINNIKKDCSDMKRLTMSGCTCSGTYIYVYV